MRTKDMLPFHGAIACDIPMADGRSISVFLWDSTPTACAAFTQLWIVEPDGRRRCFIDPIAAREVFEIYHHFDSVVGDRIVKSWDENGRLCLTLEQSGLRVVLQTATPFAVRLINRLLQTPLAALFARRGKTDTGMAYHSQPRRIESVVSAALETKDGAKTSMRPDARAFVSRCTHFLQPPSASCADVG